jgi:hypothetical protein
VVTLGKRTLERLWQCLLPRSLKQRRRVVPPPHVEESYEESNEKKVIHVVEIFLIVFY